MLPCRLSLLPFCSRSGEETKRYSFISARAKYNVLLLLHFVASRREWVFLYLPYLFGEWYFFLL